MLAVFCVAAIAGLVWAVLKLDDRERAIYERRELGERLRREDRNGA